MKNSIKGTSFWFKDGYEQLTNFIINFAPHSGLLNRLLSERYEGKKIKYIGLYFSTEKVYQLFPQAIPYHTNWYNGVLLYDDIFDLEFFNQLDMENQKQFLWKRCYEVLQEAAIKTNNPALAEASEYAYHKGLEIGLNPNFKLLVTEVVLHGVALQAAIEIRYNTTQMYSYFILEKEGKVIFEQLIDNNRVDFDIFFGFIRKIEYQNDGIILKGQRDIEYLPMKIPIAESIVKR